MDIYIYYIILFYVLEYALERDWFSQKVFSSERKKEAYSGRDELYRSFTYAGCSMRRSRMRIESNKGEEEIVEGGEDISNVIKLWT